MDRRKINLIGRDYVNWATDDDHQLTLRSVSNICDIVPIKEAEIVHSVNWQSLLDCDPKVLKNKYIISHIPHDVKNMFLQPSICKVAPFIDLFIAPSTRAMRMLSECGINAKLVPYAVDTNIFYPIKTSEQQIKELIKKYQLPKNKYLIGSFQRDTEGKDLSTPKYIKGPDVFFNIIRYIYNRYKDIHIILAGPRRFWLREHLEKEKIPYTYIGKIIKGKDDLEENSLGKEEINVLYNLIDLYIVGSRMEGGPKAILEASATKCKVVSSRVGSAEDVLSEDCLFNEVGDATQIIIKDIHENHLDDSTDINYQNALKHSIDSNSIRWKEIYNNISTTEKCHKICFKEVMKVPKNNKKLFGMIPIREKISILHKYHRPPWGGGNQFLLALKKSLKKKNIKISNKIIHKTKACIFNSFTFDFDQITKKSNKKIIMIHRVDGPTCLVRGKDKQLDDKVFSLNSQLADRTVFQSYWSLAKTLEMKYQPVNPVIIHNAADPKIFNKVGKKTFSKKSKIKLISTSWSDNVRKGFPIYKWLDENLEWSRFEYTFVGRVPGEFSNINLISPQPSERVAKILKDHDIYIIASRDEPCSNALTEALSCGLPTLYLNSGSHHELVGFGGLGFDSTEEILPRLECIIEHYEMFQDLIVVPNIDDVAEKYMDLCV
jgi:glycosyltransferase involved in cell wall biosynthesis